MKPDFSEFSYGFAVTEELVSMHRAIVIGAPMFPSLYEEGKSGGGYDLKIPLKGKPVFLQFKLSDQLKRINSKEHKSGLLKLPYYRMHIRPTKHSNQHNLLIALEEAGESVFYIAPEFHLPTELNSFYLHHRIIFNSAAFSPKAIGPMPDDGEHYIVFERGATIGYRCSNDSHKINKLRMSEGFASILSEKAQQPRDLSGNGLRAISQQMLNVWISGEQRLRDPEKPIDIPGLQKIVEERSPVESIGYMACTLFDAELLILE